MALHHNPRIVTSGLVLALDAADRNSIISGSTTWNDLSGNGHNVTLENGSLYSIENHGNIELDGTDDYVKYVLPADVNLTQGTILLMISHSYENYYLQYYDRPNNRGAATAPASVPTGFVQVGVTFDGSSHYFHINGVTTQAARFGEYGYDATTPPSVGLFGRGRNNSGTSDNVYNHSFSLNSPGGAGGAPTANTFFENFTTSSLGYYSLSSGVLGKLPAVSRPRNLDGKIYSTLIYNRALTAQEVLQNYNATKTRFGL